MIYNIIDISLLCYKIVLTIFLIFPSGNQFYTSDLSSFYSLYTHKIFQMDSSIFRNHSIKNFPLFCHLSPPPTGACIATSVPCCLRHCLMDSVTNAFADRHHRRCCCRRRRRLTDHYKCSLSRGRDMTEPSERESTKANSRKKDIQRKFRIVCRLLQVAILPVFLVSLLIISTKATNGF